MVSTPGDYPGLKFADKVYEVDIRDKEKVLEIAKIEQVDGIVTDQLDFPVPAVAYVTEKLGLPSTENCLIIEKYIQGEEDVLGTLLQITSSQI